MEVKIKTLTPLWTGGVETGKCDHIHETGILGSLRWWMEVLVRGVGGHVKDPTAEKSEHRSGLNPNEFDAKIYRQLQDEFERRKYLRNAGLCDVSQIFGATGWKHRFRLEIQDIQVTDASVQHPMKANRTYTDKQGNQKTPTWYFPDAKSPNAPKTGTFVLKIQSLHPGFNPNIIGGLIQFIADWSALGARPQMGFGVIQVEGIRIDTQPLYDWLITTVGSHTYPDLPSPQNIFLAQIQPKDPNSSFKEEDTFNLKYDLRQLFRTQQITPQQQNQSNKPITKKDKDSGNNKEKEEQELRHFIMGIEKDNCQAAKIKVSRSYNDDKLMRIWGWVPTKAEVYKNGWSREKIVDAICQHLKAHYTLHGWREMNLERDTVTANQTDVQAFLRSLLQLQENG
ncbi:type III-B CRISPR module RAMP protein Cmr1 [Leptolyngbya sp. PCC 6406]|uniref:type III-B CRISPR module RAMP protein Cmr1 n=1 Tax=Leptolyngbya sp. PCC 6406 TaxID=1173264 RepID=UPI0002AC8ACD|nr:type III-B CRISPR module RAMP protein Cmr1 [Leptolyngbya sp. PCC 6406]